MDSIKDSIQELSQHFNARMAEFQQNLSSTIPATSPTSHLAAQFSTFRSFVISSLEGLQLQVKLLAKQQDSFEMRSRRKMLLIHGVPEAKKEDVSTAIGILSKHLQMPDLCLDNISRCHRLGHGGTEKPRALIIKFRDLSLRNRIWFAKSNLKNTGFTLSEFLTRARHDAFVAARQRFGISRCWTNNGSIIVVGSDGMRHSIISVQELSNISNVSDSREIPDATAHAGITAGLKPRQAQMTRTRRTVKK